MARWAKPRPRVVDAPSAADERGAGEVEMLRPYMGEFVAVDPTWTEVIVPGSEPRAVSRALRAVGRKGVIFPGAERSDARRRQLRLVIFPFRYLPAPSLHASPLVEVAVAHENAIDLVALCDTGAFHNRFAALVAGDIGLDLRESNPSRSASEASTCWPAPSRSQSKSAGTGGRRRSASANRGPGATSCSAKKASSGGLKSGSGLLTGNWN